MFRFIGYRLAGLLILICDFCFAIFQPDKMPTYPYLLSLKKIWDKAPHNAFTDLAFFQDKFLCAFRESDSHAGSENGVIRILMSHDGTKWESVAQLELAGIDLRDPHFSHTIDGRLFLIIGGSIYEGESLKSHQSYVTFSKDGVDWDPLQKIDLPNEWLWRVTWHGSVGYVMAYSLTDLNDVDQPWILKLFKTTNGIHYELVTQLDVSSFPSEATVRFLKDDTMVALVRRDGNGWIGHAKPPYVDWKWHETNYRLGGPNFIILPDEQMWAASRLVRIIDSETKQYSTIVARMSLTEYTPLLEFPAGGDTSYPGMVYHNGKLYVSYYSSHEEKSSIYFAEVGFLPFNLRKLWPKLKEGG